MDRGLERWDVCVDCAVKRDAQIASERTACDDSLGGATQGRTRRRSSWRIPRSPSRTGVSIQRATYQAVVIRRKSRRIWRIFAEVQTGQLVKAEKWQ